jgi:hypothetical protein
MCSGLVVVLEVQLLELGGGHVPNQHGEIVETFCALTGPWDVNMGE